MSKTAFNTILVLGKILPHRKYLATAMKRFNPEARVFSCDLSKQPLPSPRFKWADYDLVLVDASTIPIGIRSWFALLRAEQCLPPAIIVDRMANVDKAGDLYRLGVSDYISLQRINDTRINLALLNAKKHSEQGLYAPARTIITEDATEQAQPSTQQSSKATPQARVPDSETTKTNHPTNSAHSITTNRSDSDRENKDTKPANKTPPSQAAATNDSNQEDVSTATSKILDSIETPVHEPVNNTGYEDDEDSGAYSSLCDQSVVTPMLQDGQNIPGEEESSSLLDASFVTSGLMSILDRNTSEHPPSANAKDPSSIQDASFVTSGLNSILNHQEKSQKTDSEFNWPFSPRQIETGEAWIDDYQIYEFLSIGHASTVFKAKAKGDNTTRVVKLFNRELVNTESTLRFSRGYQLLSEVEHKNISRIYDQAQHKDWFYVVMEYFPKGDLKSRMRKRIRLGKIIHYSVQIAKGLQAAHQNNIIHRALKPTDILFRDDDSLALADFGISRQINPDEYLTQEGIIVGKPDYISPEQAKGLQLDARSDLYSLGIIMYEMLEGRRPFIGASRLATINGHVNTPVPPMSHDHHGVEYIVTRLLEKNPEDRYNNAQSLIADLNGCARLVSG